MTVNCVINRGIVGATLRRIQIASSPALQGCFAGRATFGNSLVEAPSGDEKPDDLHSCTNRSKHHRVGSD